MKAVTGQHAVESETSKVSLYRTRWLMAHNRLHAIAHDSKVSVKDTWDDYLKELSTSEAVAKTPA